MIATFAAAGNLRAALFAISLRAGRSAGDVSAAQCRALVRHRRAWPRSVGWHLGGSTRLADGRPRSGSGTDADRAVDRVLFGVARWTRRHGHHAHGRHHDRHSVPDLDQPDHADPAARHRFDHSGFCADAMDRGGAPGPRRGPEAHAHRVRDRIAIDGREILVAARGAISFPTFCR